MTAQLSEIEVQETEMGNNQSLFPYLCLEALGHHYLVTHPLAEQRLNNPDYESSDIAEACVYARSNTSIFCISFLLFFPVSLSFFKVGGI